MYFYICVGTLASRPMYKYMYMYIYVHIDQ